MVDYWIDCNHVSCYISFLEKLYNLITVPKETIRKSLNIDKKDTIIKNNSASHLNKTKSIKLLRNQSSNKLELNINIDLLPHELNNTDQNVLSPSKIPISQILQEKLITPTNIYKLHSTQSFNFNNSTSSPGINNSKNALLSPLLSRNNSFSKLSSSNSTNPKKLQKSNSATITPIDNSKDLLIETRTSSRKWKELNAIDPKAFENFQLYFLKPNAENLPTLKTPLDEEAYLEFKTPLKVLIYQSSCLSEFEILFANKVADDRTKIKELNLSLMGKLRENKNLFDHISKLISNHDGYVFTLTLEILPQITKLNSDLLQNLCNILNINFFQILDLQATHFTDDTDILFNDSDKSKIYTLKPITHDKPARLTSATRKSLESLVTSGIYKINKEIKSRSKSSIKNLNNSDLVQDLISFSESYDSYSIVSTPLYKQYNLIAENETIVPLGQSGKFYNDQMIDFLAKKHSLATLEFDDMHFILNSESYFVSSEPNISILKELALVLYVAAIVVEDFIDWCDVNNDAIWLFYKKIDVSSEIARIVSIESTNDYHINEWAKKAASTFLFDSFDLLEQYTFYYINDSIINIYTHHFTIRPLTSTIRSRPSTSSRPNSRSAAPVNVSKPDLNTKSASKNYIQSDYSSFAKPLAKQALRNRPLTIKKTYPDSRSNILFPETIQIVGSRFEKELDSYSSKSEYNSNNKLKLDKLVKDVKLPFERFTTCISLPMSPEVSLLQDFDFTDSMSKTSYFSPSKAAVVDQVVKNRHNLLNSDRSAPINNIIPNPPISVAIDTHFPSIPTHIDRYVVNTFDNMSPLSIPTPKFLQV